MATGSRRVLGLLGLLSGSLLIGFGGLAVPKAALAVYAIAQYGEPKYPADFKHFDYVNPHAPRGGTLVLANPNRLTSFDKFNPFTQRGNPAPGLGYMFESLTTGSLDEVSTAYGLLADDISIAPDGLSATFHINPKARFSNGDPVTAEDVKYSFDTLKSPQAAPQYAVYFGQISHAVILDPLTIRFDFRERTREMPFIAGAIPVFSRKWGMKPDGSHVPFDQLAFQKPIASGPYLIEQYDNGRTITFKRDPAYWGNALPVRVGSFNFERITYKLYSDGVARLEAFKAGEYDALVEYIARNWVRADQARISQSQRHWHAGLFHQPAPADFPGRARASGARSSVRLPVAEPATVFQPVHAHRQLLCKHRSASDGQAERGRTRDPLAVTRATRSRCVRQHGEAAGHGSTRFIAREPDQGAQAAGRRGLDV
jgi:microcin C transport system substrate-binding protein